MFYIAEFFRFIGYVHVAKEPVEDGYKEKNLGR